MFDPRVLITSYAIWSFQLSLPKFFFHLKVARRVSRAQLRRVHKTSYISGLTALTYRNFKKSYIMGKNTTESKEIEKADVEIVVRSDVPEGGWGWLVCLAGFIAQFVILGLQNNTGILYKALLEEFKASKGDTGRWLLLFPGHIGISCVLRTINPAECVRHARFNYHPIYLFKQPTAFSFAAQSCIFKNC